MARNYYIFNPGRLSRKQNTVFFTRYSAEADAKSLADFEDRIEQEPSLLEEEPPVKYEESGEKKVIPVEDIDSSYVFGEADFNRKFFNFCGSKGIPVHIFNYFGFYSGTFYPREFLNSGEVLLRQVRAFDDPDSRLFLARQFTRGASANMLRNLQYYHNRGKELSRYIEPISSLREQMMKVRRIDELMGIEGNVRQWYYSAWPEIIEPRYEFERRIKHPPNNLINALISFGNSMVYTTCLSEIYRTQLSPLISYLHEPGTKRFSLSLDIAEIFKPLLTDRLIFSLLNKRQITDKHATQKGNVCWLNEEGRKLFVRAYEEKLNTTIKHRKLNRNVSYRRLIRLECYKLIKHLMQQESYKPFEIWW